MALPARMTESKQVFGAVFELVLLSGEWGRWMSGPMFGFNMFQHWWDVEIIQESVKIAPGSIAQQNSDASPSHQCQRLVLRFQRQWLITCAANLR